MMFVAVTRDYGSDKDYEWTKMIHFQRVYIGTIFYFFFAIVTLDLCRKLVLCNLVILNSVIYLIYFVINSNINSRYHALILLSLNFDSKLM